MRHYALLLVLVVAITPAHSLWAQTVLFDQPVFNVNDRGAFSEFSGQQLADNFTVTSSSTVGAVRWFGSYLNTDLPGSTTSVNFVIRFFDESGSNLPVISPFNNQAIAASVTVTGFVFEGRMIYQFDAVLASVFVSGGTQYWFSTLENDVGTADGFRWANSTVTPSDFSAFRSIEGGSWNSILDDNRSNQAFTFFGAVVPEPATFVLAGASGLALAGGIYRQRYKRKTRCQRRGKAVR